LPHQPRTLNDVFQDAVAGSAIPASANGVWSARLVTLVEALLQRSPNRRPRDSHIVHELVALEIASLSGRRAG
jgi:hypothetical protein